MVLLEEMDLFKVAGVPGFELGVSGIEEVLGVTVWDLAPIFLLLEGVQAVEIDFRQRLKIPGTNLAWLYQCWTFALVFQAAWTRAWWVSRRSALTEVHCVSVLM